MKLHVNGTTYTGMAPPDTNYNDFFVAPLSPGTATATQQACGATSPTSNTATIQNTPAVTTGVTLTEPLMECGRAAHVTNAHIGALLQVWAKTDMAEAPISGIVVAGASDLTIGVAPYLRRGDLIRVIQYGCSDQGVNSNAAQVKAHDEPQPPNVAEPVYAGAIQVTVNDVLPGALVNVYVPGPQAQQSRLAGSTVATSDSVVVNLTTGVGPGMWVSATQTLCGTQTKPGPAVTAVPPPPQTPVITNPKQGETNVPKRPDFTWTDPGAGGFGAATLFEFQVNSSTTAVIPPTSVTTTSVTPRSDLPAGQMLTVQVQAKNATGSSSPGQVVFSTQGAPGPAAPVLSTYDTTTKTLIGHNFLPSATVTVRLSMFTNTVTGGSNGPVPDTRDVFLPFTSDPAGKLSAVIDPNTALPPLALDDQSAVYGAAPGETMHFSANDSRTDPNNVTGVLWSNTLNVTA